MTGPAGPDHHGAPQRGASVWSDARPPWLLDLDRCASTNDWALDHLPHLAHGCVVHTSCQTAGRGQHGRRWHSPPGVLTASVVVDVAGSAVARHLSLVAGLAVAHAVEDLAPDETVAIKWPNDCYCRGGKLGGILCEARQQGSRLRAVVGIGLNVAPRWTGGEDLAAMVVPPIALIDLGVADPGPLPLLAALRGYLLEGLALLRAGRWEILGAQLRRRDALEGRRCSVRLLHAHLQGRGAGIDDQGRLVLALDDGGHRTIEGGSVALTDPDHGARAR